jgi:hypothetical protein
MVDTILFCIHVRKFEGHAKIANRHEPWKIETKVKVTLRPTVSRPVHFGIGPSCGANDQFLIFFV